MKWIVRLVCTLAAIFMILMVVFGGRDVWRYFLCRNTAKAEVINVEQDGGSRSSPIFITVHFDADGVTKEAVIRDIARYKPKVGDTIKVRYNLEKSLIIRQRFLLDLFSCIWMIPIAVTAILYAVAAWSYVSKEVEDEMEGSEY